MTFYMVYRDQTKCFLCGNLSDASSVHFEPFTLNKEHRFFRYARYSAHGECLLREADFEEFRTFYLAEAEETFQRHDWLLCPVGDEFVDLMSSTECQVDPPQYDAAEVVSLLGSMPGASVRFEGESCRILWESGNEAIEYQTDASGEWVGASLVPACRPATLVGQWRAMQARLPRVFLYNGDCAIFAPDYFELVYINEPLRRLRRTPV